MGVLVSRQGGRYTVTDLSPSRLVAPFNTMLSVADYDVHEQFEARTVVDLELVRLCAERAAPGACGNASSSLRSTVAPSSSDPVAFRLLDIEFHQAINDGAGNGLLCGAGAGALRPGARRAPHARAKCRASSRRASSSTSRSPKPFATGCRGGRRRLSQPSRACARHHHPVHGVGQPIEESPCPNGSPFG